MRKRHTCALGALLTLSVLVFEVGCGIEEHPGWADGLSESTESRSAGDTFADAESGPEVGDEGGDGDGGGDGGDGDGDGDGDLVGQPCTADKHCDADAGEECCTSSQCLNTCMVPCASDDECAPTLGCEHSYCLNPCANNDSDCSEWSGFTCQHTDGDGFNQWCENDIS